MPDEIIEVKSYSGHRGEEAPRSFILHGREIEIAEVLDSWIEEDVQDRRRKRFFRVKGIDGIDYRIYVDVEIHAWYIHKS